MIIHKVPIIPYSLDMWVIISKDPHRDVSEMNVRHPGVNIPWSDDCAAWTNDHVWENVICVVFDKKYCEPDTIAHEVVHVVNMVYTFSGIKHDANNDEPQAYLTGYLVGEIHKALKMKDKK